MLATLTDTDPGVVGRYRIQGRLGSGGMGAVYLGFDPDGRPAAVKVIRPDLVNDVEFRERFRREVAAARRVRGPFVAEVLDADVDAESPWMATEYVDGVTLTAAVARRGHLDGAMLTGVSSGLANALASVHAAGLVHRDLKPSNILLGREGPKIIDFGIARALDGTVHTSTGAVLGTVAWMAPEQLRGERAGPPADIFAWAMCVAFAARGRHPFPAEAPAATAIRMLQDHPDLTDVPEHLIPLLVHALDKDPARRPSAVEAVSALLGAEVTSLAEAEHATRLAMDGSWIPPTPSPPPQIPDQPPVSAQAQAGPSAAADRPVDRTRDRHDRRTGLRNQLPLVAAAVILIVGAAAALLVKYGPSDRDKDQSALGPEQLRTAAAKGGSQSAGPLAGSPSGRFPSAGATGGGAAAAMPPTQAAPPRASVAAGQPGQVDGAPAAASTPAPNMAPDQAASAAPPRPAAVALVRYNNGPDHAALTGPAPAGYQSEGVLGSVYQSSGVPGTRPLYACWAGSDSFTSTASNCEGQQVAGVLGWIYGSAPSTPATRAIIRCNTGRGDHFVSLDPACEGLVVEGALGYVIAG
ncbi:MULTISPECIES: serine/threonine-protein kinase [unclassified Pseudofrankia]|uniref:serine/threonine-protein kinase n=1 Tax=unclassified Pseudofrankia TaxID=2994372 RepID=UPI0008DA1E07|nr:MULTISPECIES: serine/threonine-protein kinase [unclassified Pseudofrankia]MDT3444101.1 serine/threonine-protein kinase [Pseudofrankia sp. BMG5.37]OHV65317.1 hypothetical protein BCD48_04285 [Pseudofrankia sp. BMG5.36]